MTYRKASTTHDGVSADDAAMDTVFLRDDNAAEPVKRKSPKAKSAARDSQQPAFQMTAPQQAAETALRAWRKSLAADQGKPAFLILSDAVLRGIALAQPGTLGELATINGVGPSKVEAYGSAILQCCGERAEPARSFAPPPSATRIPKSTVSAPPPPKAPPVVNLVWDAAMLQVESQLKAWRAEEAKRLGMPGFFILSDSALRNIVSAAPASPEALRAVRGVDAEKAEKFGMAILQACAPQPAL